MRGFRWTDNDRRFGPFIYGYDTWTERIFSVALQSGDRTDYPGASLSLSIGRHTFVIELPQWMCPLPKDDRDLDLSNEYSFSISSTYWQVYWGMSNIDTSPMFSGVPFWAQWRTVGCEVLNVDGSVYARDDRFFTMREFPDSYQPAIFNVVDYDGAEVTANVVLYDLTRRRGESPFWRAFFRFWPLSRERCMDVTFSAETGRRKGSWKGGTISCWTGVPRHAAHEEALESYTMENEMILVGWATQPTSVFDGTRLSDV